MGDGAICGYITAAPVIGAECFGQTVGPHTLTTIADHRQFETRYFQRRNLTGEAVGITVFPLEEYIYADQFLFSVLVLNRFGRFGVATTGCVRHLLELLRALTKTLD